MALVTVAIPTFNRLAFLEEAVASALNQDYEDIEILISDDGTEADIASWGKSQEASNRRIRYLHTPTRLGLAGNWNYCVQQARGEFILIIGDDDRLLPLCVGTLINLGKDVDVAFSNHYCIDSRGNRLHELSLRYTQGSGRDQLASGVLDNPEKVIWKNSIPISSALLRRKVVQKLQFRSDLNTPEIEFYLRLQATGGRFLFCPDYLVEYRVHDYSATASGLWTEKLVGYLIDFPVSKDVEPLKRHFLEGLLPNAVSRLIDSGNFFEARKVKHSGYYPSSIKSLLHSFVQELCLFLPKGAGMDLHRWAKSLKNGSSSSRSDLHA